MLSVSRYTVAHERPTPNPQPTSFNGRVRRDSRISVTIVSGMDAELVFPNFRMEYGTCDGDSFNFLTTVSLSIRFAWWNR